MPQASRSNPERRDAVDLDVLDDSVVSMLRNTLDEADFRPILDSLPEESGKCLAAIQAAIGLGDLEEARRVAHGLKGMAGNLGAKRLAKLAQTIECQPMGLAEMQQVVPELAEAIADVRQRIAAVA